MRLTMRLWLTKHWERIITRQLQCRLVLEVQDWPRRTMGPRRSLKSRLVELRIRDKTRKRRRLMLLTSAQLLSGSLWRPNNKLLNLHNQLHLRRCKSHLVVNWSKRAKALKAIWLALMVSWNLRTIARCMTLASSKLPIRCTSASLKCLDKILTSLMRTLIDHSDGHLSSRLVWALREVTHREPIFKRCSLKVAKAWEASNRSNGLRITVKPKSIRMPQSRVVRVSAPSCHCVSTTKWF